MTAPQAPEPDGSGASSGDSIIQRMARAGQEEHRARAMSLARALRQTCAKVGDTLLDLPLGVIAVQCHGVLQEALGDRIAPGSLLMLLEGPQAARAAAVLDIDLVTALIQQQIMGQVLSSAGQADRRLTPTDAAICAPFVDAVLSRAAPLPEDPREQRLLNGFAFGAWMEDPRVLCLALDAREYEVVELTLDIAGGVTQGRLTLCLPEPAGGLPVDDPDGDEDATPVTTATTRPTLCDNVQNLRADLRIGLASLRMSLRQLGSLQVGSTLDIGVADFSDVQVQCLAGRTVSRGALGQLDGLRAVQVAHRDPGPSQPRRRASDRVALNLPDIGAPPRRRASDNRVAEADRSLPAQSETDMPESPPEVAGQGAEMPEMPDMSDLPDFDNLPPFSETG